MTNEVTPIDRAANAMSPAMRARMQAEIAKTNRNFQDGIQDAFPILSIRGRTFRARISGKEIPYIDPNTREQATSLNVVLVNASRHLAKAYYAKGFAQGDASPPNCWSIDSIKPDSSIANPVNPTCQDCPMNAFGSRVIETAAGDKKVKACSDARRVAVIMPHEIASEQPRIFLLRVPQSSLKNLKLHTQHLDRFGIGINACVTKLSFGIEEAYPKLLFEYVRTLGEDQYFKVLDLANSSYVNGMLTGPDFDPAQSRAQEEMYTPPREEPMREAAPILAEEPDEEPPTIQPEFKQAPPKEETVKAEAKANIRQLKNGQWVDFDTGEFVDPPKAEVKLDPNTRQLVDGRFYNFTIDDFVTGPEIGAPKVEARKEQPKQEAKAEPEKPKRTRRTKEEMEADKAKEQPKPEAKAAPQEDEGQPILADDPQVDARPNGDGNRMSIEAATSELEDVLEGIE